MDDTLKSLTLGLFALAVVHGSLIPRIRHNAARQTREAFNNTGPVRAEVAPRGALGLIVSDLWSVDIYGQRLQVERLPFYRYPKTGWKGSIRHLRLHLQDFTLADLPIESFEADIPFVTFDIGHAIWKDRIVVRGAGEGPGEVRIASSGLRAFIYKKFHSTLSDVEVWTQNKKLYLSGRVAIALLGTRAPFTASGNLLSRAGRYLDLIDPQMRLNGVPMSPQAINSLLASINPVLDTEQDLHLGGYFVMTDVEIGDNELTIRGRVTVPSAAQSFGQTSALPGQN